MIFLTFFIVPNQLETRHFRSEKVFWSRCSVEYDSMKKPKTTSDGFWVSSLL